MRDKNDTGELIQSVDSNGVCLGVVNRDQGTGPYGAEIVLYKDLSTEVGRVRISKDLFRMWLQAACEEFGVQPLRKK